MGKTKNNHYLSQCISKNFIQNGSKTFWQYDCSKGDTIKPTNIVNLFSRRRIWGQEFENTINKHMENHIAPILKRLSECPVERNRTLGPTGFVEPQFNGVHIDSKEDCVVLSKLILQFLLLQRSNEGQPNSEIEEKLTLFFSHDDNIMEMPLFLIEINPLINAPPLILTDGMLFTFAAPTTKKNALGHISFAFPINPQRLLIWGIPNDIDFFAAKYANIHQLNLCRIEQHNKRCKIASQDKKYLETLISTIPRFKSGEKSIRISADRIGFDISENEIQ